MDDFDHFSITTWLDEKSRFPLQVSDYEWWHIKHCCRRKSTGGTYSGDMPVLQTSYRICCPDNTGKQRLRTGAGLKSAIFVSFNRAQDNI